MLAWAALALIVFVTVAPIEFRPHDLLPVEINRVLAFAVMAMLFAVAYPRRIPLLAVTLIACAGLIEAMQLLSPSRHAHFNDAVVKASGAVLGVGIGWALNHLVRTRRLRLSQ
ncbi:VanZ family protein [Rhizobium sp. NTR19]|uniref:VanZ family protein n=1 Tax=Neorhizobium turbinariae TaxID=2937795 RepID=A0ABT0IX49_9HYPH|nr:MULTISPECIES: VanZ family protein [Neorhizobium]MCK8782467.1 VanZ family protein [Neorhizobium turbinariae]